MVQVLGFRGAKKSGKDLCANYLMGAEAARVGMITGFGLLEDGDILGQFAIDDGSTEEYALGLDKPFGKHIEKLAEVLFPHVFKFGFADELKFFCHSMFGLDLEIIYGTDDDKNTPTNFNWENMPTKVKGKSGLMTHREFLQYWGTEIFRKIDPDFWVKKARYTIETGGSERFIIKDISFDNETQMVQDLGGKVIGLTRNPAGATDTHASENGRRDLSSCDFVVDNTNLSIEETVHAVYRKAVEWGFLSDTLGLASV